MTHEMIATMLQKKYHNYTQHVERSVLDRLYALLPTKLQTFQHCYPNNSTRGLFRSILYSDWAFL